MGARVSVIIPAHNARASLPQTLDSIIAQTYGDWEAIVADDCSTDGTGEIAKGYHPRVACVRSPRNLGIGGARNLALDASDGELVALLDADDVWLPNYLERQVARYDAAAAAGENVGIVCCDAFEIDAGGTRRHTYAERVGWADPPTLTTLVRRNTIFVSALVPRALIEHVGGFATDCLGTEDYDMWLRILESGSSVLAVREPLACYRRSDASVSADPATMARATQTVYRNALERGRLDGHQRAIVKRELRLQELVELHADWTQTRAPAGRSRWALAARTGLLGARVMLERPEDWTRWLRLGGAQLRGMPARLARSQSR
jgi:glycosyltransferase involved in cell wall biosynthesis